MNIKNLLITILFFSITLFGDKQIYLTQEEQAYLKKHPIIRVSNNLDFPPFDYAVDKKPLGYSVDLLTLLLDKIGIKAKFVNKASWDRLLQSFKEGKIDLLHAVTKTEARKELAIFSNAYFKTRGCFFTHSSLPKIKNVNFFNHRTVAVVKGWKPGKYLQEHYPKINLLHVDSIDEMVSAVENNSAVGFFNECIPVFFYEKLWNIDSVIPNVILDEFFDNPDNSLFFAAHKDARPLIDILNKAYASLTSQELNYLRRKWIQPSWEDDFSPMSFTKQEEEWIRKNSFIKLAYVKHWDYDSDALLHIERSYVELLSKYSNVDIWLIVFDSWQEAYEETIKNNQADGMLYLTKNRDIKSGFDYLPSYSSMPLLLQVKRDSRIRDLKDLQGKKLYTIENSYSNDFIKMQHYNIETVSLKNDQEFIQQLSSMNSNLEAGLSYSIDSNLIKQNTLKIAKKIYDRNSTARIGVLKGKKEVYSILKKAHEKIPKKELIQLQNSFYWHNNSLVLADDEKKYLKSLNKIVMCVTPNWLPFSDIRKGKVVGMVEEYIKKLQTHIPQKFIIPKVGDWSTIVAKTRDQKCDIVSFLEKTESRTKYLNFTKSLVDVSYVIAGSSDKLFVDDFSSIEDKVFAIEDKSGIYENMKLMYPRLKVVPVKNAREGLEQVKEHKVYGFIDTAITIAYEANKHNNMNFKIICKLPMEYNLAFGVTKDKPMLFEIINKIINTIDKDESKRIYNKWVALQQKEVVDYRLVWEIVFVGVLILFFVILWNRKIARANKLLKDAQVEIKQKNEKLLEYVNTDRLTGLFNRFKLDEVLESEIKRYQRYKHPLSLCILDCDRFKRINDTYGHQIGDIILQELSSIFKQNVRATDSIYRWGGEEFIILCPNTDVHGVELLAQKLRRAIEAFKFTKVGSCTASFGVTACRKDDTSTTFIKRADEALLEAKGTGRNKVVMK